MSSYLRDIRVFKNRLLHPATRLCSCQEQRCLTASMGSSNTGFGARIMRDLPIRWGVSLPNRGVLFGLTDIDTLMNAAALAEQSGVFESVWFGDSLIHKPRLESTVMLSAVAARTQKIR